MWVAALCDPFVVVDRRPEVEGDWPWSLFRTSISPSRISEKEFGWPSERPVFETTFHPLPEEDGFP